MSEKIELLSGRDDFYTYGVPRLGIPRLKFSDGPVGIRNDKLSVAYPAGACLASTWDPALALRFGKSIGADARAQNIQVWLGPGVNLARIPQNGRNFEYLGEDPLLCGLIATQIIKGVQSKGVSATIKHFAGNEHEWDRNNDSSDVDERTLRELYLKQFEIAVKSAQPGAVMCAYNLLNGTYCSANHWLLTDVLKQQWGFKGVLMTDWGAAHSTLPMFDAGTDLEMPSGDFFNKTTLTDAISHDSARLALLDDKVRRLLTLIDRFHFNKPPLPLKPDPELGEPTSLQIAREGTVLLKNQQNLLPFDAKKTKRILIVGPNANPAVTGGGGSSYVQPTSSLSLADGMKAMAPNGISVEFRPVLGASLLRGFETTDFGEAGVKAEFWDNPSLQGPASVTNKLEKINATWSNSEAFPIQSPNGVSARMVGTAKVESPGTYMLVARISGGFRVSIDGNVLGEDWRDQGTRTRTWPITFEVVGAHVLQIDHFHNGQKAEIRLGLTKVESALAEDLPASVLQDFDAVVAAVGFRNWSESEGFDRPFELPLPQAELLSFLVSHGQHPVVVNFSGAGVDLSPWNEDLAGVLQAWYPGGVGAQAIAEILFGITNPSGKLPTSFPKSLHSSYYEDAYPPKEHHIAYKEGLLMGYRWFDTNHTDPLYPFGFGLSYTSFRIGNLKVAKKGKSVHLQATVVNSGKRAGTQTVQVYVGKPGSSISRSIHELRAFKRVNLKAGERREVEFTLDPKDWSYWNADQHQWKLESGAYKIEVGTSSKDLPLQAVVKI